MQIKNEKKKATNEPGGKIIKKKRSRAMTNKSKAFLPETEVLKAVGQPIFLTLF